jgi:Phosphate-selective porin O and P
LSRKNQRAYKKNTAETHGRVDNIKFNTEWVGAAEDVNGSNTGLTLLDFSFDVPLFNTESTWFKVGQFKVPYSRESITDEAQFQLVEHSINFLGFNLGRDVGAALHTYQGRFAGTMGIFTGGARDVPLRFLPEHLGVPMLVARLGYNDGLDKDVFTIAQNDLRPQRTVKATYINAMFMKNTHIGHSTVLQARNLRISGARVQGGVLMNKFETTIRYAVMVPDENFAKSGTKITGNRPIQEVVPALSYYIKGHDHKVVLDFPVLIDVPIFIENAAGAYVSVEQPDQASVIVPATGRVERQTVPEARLMY